MTGKEKNEVQECVGKVWDLVKRRQGGDSQEGDGTKMGKARYEESELLCDQKRGFFCTIGSPTDASGWPVCVGPWPGNSIVS